MTWWPGWDSIASAGYWSHFWFWFGIACLFALGASEIVSHVYGLRKDELVAVAESNVSAQRKIDETEAKKQSDAEAAQLREQLAKAERVATEASDKAKELDRLRQPRHLTEEQKKTLQGRLTGRPKLQLVIKAGTATGDERAYAEEIASVLRAIAWDVRVDSALFMGADTSGLWLSVKGSGGEPVPEPVEILRFALASVGLDIRDAIEGNLGIPEVSEVWLSIGRKK
jgi:hypothetical protein